eukprot:scaffold1034_cov127-Cylindrotheca_fusiformis.AAC.31
MSLLDLRHTVLFLILAILSCCQVADSSNLHARRYANLQVRDTSEDTTLQAKLEPVGKAVVDLGTSLVSLSKYVAKPIQKRIQELIKDNNSSAHHHPTAPTRTKKQAFYTESEMSPKQSVAIVLFPSRILKLSLSAWILSEALDFLGILNDDTPLFLKYQMDRVWYDIQPKLHHVAANVQNWWAGTITKENLERIPSKYNFAVGTSLGMIAAPLSSVVVGSLWQPLVVTYLIAEINANRRANGKVHLGSLLERKLSRIGAILERGLERLRRTIRSAFPQPQIGEGALLRTSGGSRDVPISRRPNNNNNNKRGHSEIHRTYIFPWGRSKEAVDDEVVVYKETHRPEHPIVAMIRHGFMVGSAIGLFIRV